nr:hypothetical protein [Mucilaginibacter sp. L294]
MNGTIAQLVSLVTYGNAYLKQEISPEELNLYCSTFINSGKVEFIDYKEGFLGIQTQEISTGVTPLDWFKYLKAQRCTSLKLYYEHSADQSMFKDHKTSGLVGGGGVWLIESAHEDGGFKYWFGKWEVITIAPDKSIWAIIYYAVLVAKESRIKQFIPLNTAKETLLNTLKRTLDFSLKNDTGFSESFENAIKNIDDPNPRVDYYKDLVPSTGLSLSQQQLLCAAASSWVFGGMGSWNDLGFPDKETQPEYGEISQTLYDDVITAIISVINS